ncbi:RHS repeat-associated core domain-containing protein [Candidatus Thiodiazotropha endoloripes]|uniref:RHS repeat-associated core domain-containing protein n=1 Tax=Candidatus Thiodiazotropha endoloripes TaxID=1818881 RepID=UPI000903210C|nr:RHS repeat-associated core domain-containing protein [Candidatus Thiodiazotropha endoloripes]
MGDSGYSSYTSTTYDDVGNIRSTTDAESRITQYRYDALNRLIEIIDPLNQSTIFHYDNRDNLLSVTDPNNHTTRYTYDRADRKRSEIRPGGQTISYNYDPAGNLITTTDPDGRRTVSIYDEAGQLETQAHYAPGATDPERSITYTYDHSGNMTGWSDGAVNAILVYDENNQKTSETVNYGAFSLSHGYTYDSAGNKRTYTGPDGITITYHHVNDQLNRIELPNEGSITYNSYRWSQPTKITYPGGSNRQTEYDDLLRPTRILSQDPGQNPLMDYQYHYDSTGNILQKTTQTKSIDYDYDFLQRLSEAVTTIPSETGEPQIEVEGWQYDPNGNRTLDNLNPGGWIYDNNDRLESSPTTSYGYDQAGNTISKTEEGVVTNYFYNAEGRLSRIEDANQTLIAEYLYDPLGRRYKKITQAETIYFHYSDEGMVGEFNDTGNPIRLYGYVPDSIWTTDPIYQKTDQGYAYYQNDHLGTPQQLMQKNGAEVWKGELRAFGELITESGTYENRLRFPGQYYDQESGYYQNSLRDYNPLNGRYLESDPIGLKGGLNRYAYALLSPVNQFDPYGLYSWGDAETAWAHYCDGTQTPWSTSFGSINWGESINNIKNKIESIGAQSGCVKGKRFINLTHSGQTDGADKYIIGRHNIKVRGIISTHCDCKWEFSGTIASARGYDPYNFNPSNRGPAGEALTWVGRNRCPSTGATFNININGSQSLTLNGTAQGTPTCCRP